MGMGDDIMFLGEAELIHKRTGKTIKPMHGSGWSPFFNKIPWLSRDGEISVNARDTNHKTDIHVDYYEKRRERTEFGERLVFRDYKPKPFRVRLSNDEMDNADRILSDHNIKDRFFVINPDYKNTFYCENKNWGFEKYQDLATRLSKHIEVVRIMPGGLYKEPELAHTTNIVSEKIMPSVALMSKAHAAVGYDGLMNHIMAGYQIPMVVICGGLVDDSLIGYETGTYIKYEHPQTPCGSTYDCPHCEEANKSITVDMVYEECLKLL